MYLYFPILKVIDTQMGSDSCYGLCGCSAQSAMMVSFLLYDDIGLTASMCV